MQRPAGRTILTGLAASGIEVTEAIRPNRQARRRRGKSDPADAIAAALAALNGEASEQPKSSDGAVESIWALQPGEGHAASGTRRAGRPGEPPGGLPQPSELMHADRWGKGGS
jgi:transposase